MQSTPTLKDTDPHDVFAIETLLHAHAEKVSVFIKNTVGITARIRAVAPDTLERSLGKAKRVYDKRPKG